MPSSKQSNLPQQVNGSDTDVSIVYDAGGRKWKKDAAFEDEAGNPINKTTLYVGAFEFEQTPQYSLRLHSINGHADGREVKVYDSPATGDVPSRLEYYHKDHLGNVRLTFSDLNQDGAITVGSIYDPSNEIVFEKHYYPFGLEMTGEYFATVVPDNAYRYNGKELDEATGLYDYGARYYDPAIARWGQVDPAAEKYAPWSPYHYTYCNPIKYNDPTGMAGNLSDGVHLNFQYNGEMDFVDFVAASIQYLANVADVWSANGADLSNVTFGFVDASFKKKHLGENDNLIQFGKEHAIGEIPPSCDAVLFCWAPEPDEEDRL
ncbi:MAG: RHS repeat-associated core domain-containing protein, partial [Bacteroidota bacterium]